VNADDGHTAMPKMERRLLGALCRREALTETPATAAELCGENVRSAPETLGKTQFLTTFNLCHEGHQQVTGNRYLQSTAMSNLIPESG
jgi:hypothetical protein